MTYKTQSRQAVAPLFALLDFIPRWFRVWVNKVGTLLYLKFSHRDRRVLFTNLERIRGLDPSSLSAQTFARKVIASQALIPWEIAMAVRAKTPIQATHQEKLWQSIRRLHAQGRGVVIVSLHLGNWELFGHLCSRAGVGGLHAPGKAAQYHWQTNTICAMREALQMHALNHDTKLPGNIRQLLREGKLVGFVGDQKPSERRGPVVEFFNQATPFVAGPALFARHYHSPILLGSLIRKFCEDGSWRWHVLQELVWEGEGKPAIKDLTQDIARAMEKMIRAYPEQWCWNYKRWKFDR